MPSAVRLKVNKPSRVAGGHPVSADLLVAIAFLAALFFGVVGEDKFLLLSPLVVAGWLCLAVWAGRTAFSRHGVTAAPPGFFLLLLFVAYGVWLIPSSSIPYEARVRMLQVGLCVGAYYLWSNAYAQSGRGVATVGWVMMLALLGCFYGLVNHFKNPEMVLWAERYYDYGGRLASTYICPNHFAHLLQMLLPFGLVLLLMPEGSWLMRILTGYCIAVYIPTIFLTESRAGMLGSIAAVGVTVCLLALRRSKKLFAGMVIVVPLLSALLLAGAWHASDMFRERMEPVVKFLSEVREEGFTNTSTADFRPLTWLDTIDMIKERPATGFGPGSYRYVFPEYRTRFRGNRIVTGHPHNEYLEVSVEYGLIGFALLALAWGYGLIRLLIFALRTDNPRHALLAMAFLGTAAGTLLHSFFDFQLYIFQNALVFALLAAVAAAPLCARRQEALMKRDGSEGLLRRPLPRTVRIGLALAALSGLIVALPLHTSAFFRSVADRLAAAGRLEAATHCYHRAIQIDASNWRACKGLGALLFKDRYYTLEPDKKRRLGEMEQECFRNGYRHNPRDAALVFDYGMSTIFLGERDAGIALLQQAAGLRPFNDLYWLRLGMELRKAERYEEAMEAFTYSQQLNNSSIARANIAWLRRRQNAVPQPEAAPADRAEPVEIDLAEPPPEKDRSLDDLFNLMETP